MANEIEKRNETFLIDRINNVLRRFFNENSNVGLVPAKDLMPYFIQANIFKKDHKDGLPIRKILRELDDTNNLSLIPFAIKQQKAKNRNWFFFDTDIEVTKGATNSLFPRNNKRNPKSRENSDEYYIIGLCDEVLGLNAIHQATFDFLLDDNGNSLKVYAYYDKLKIVVEYLEIQHFKKGMFGNRYCPASKMHRNEQRALYDQRRRDILPLHGYRLIEIPYYEFAHNSRYKLLRNRDEDIKIVRRLLNM